MKKNLFIFILLCLIIILVYGKLPQTFYQQDEWFGLGLAFGDGINSVFNGVTSPLDFLFVKGRILASFIFFLFVNFFPLQNSPLAILAIVLHVAASFLVFVLIEKFLKTTAFAFFGAIFFAVNGVSHGAISWPAIAINTATSTILILLAILFFLKYLNTNKSLLLLIAGVMIYISLWFKETGVYLFALLPFSGLLFKRYSFSVFIKTYAGFIAPFFLIVFYRVMELSMRTTYANLYLTGQSENFFLTILLRSIIYPITSFSLMFVPGEQFLLLARTTLRQIYPFFAPLDQNILIAQTAILDMLAIILTFAIILFIILLLKRERKENKKVIFFWLVFTFMSFLPYVLLSKDFAYLESRYYYLSVVGGAFIISWILKRIRQIFGLKIFCLIFSLYIFYLISHAGTVYNAISEQVKLSTIRKGFITQLRTIVPSLDNNINVFYTTSDQNFWADGNKLPFQQGNGFTLMVLYNDSNKIPKEFFKEGFLFDIGSQGYREIGDRGFGYFWDKNELEKAVKLYNLPNSSIINLQYISDMNKLSRSYK